MLIECRQLSRKKALEALTATCEVAMKFQIKLFSWDDKGNHLIVLARGFMDIGAFKRLFEEIAEATRPLSDCKVLADLSDSTYEFEAADVNVFVGELPPDAWPRGNKVALVSGPNLEDYQRLYLLRAALAGRGFAAGVFRDSNVAIDWLAGRI